MASREIGLLHSYRDPHVTNCCAAWFCPGGTGCGYPVYAYENGPELGYVNYSVFFYGCNFDCLYCQNSSHKEIEDARTVKAEELVYDVKSDRRYSCICYFGGSPEPQLPFAINVSRRVVEETRGRILRVCFEWNGCGNRALVREAAQLALETGGNIKFDLKCFDETMSFGLSGVSNRRAYENFRMIANDFLPNRNLPVLTATTLMVPEYVGVEEVEKIARFIADFDQETPYSLLIFHPDYAMWDLPVTPRRQVDECYHAAKKFLKRVNIGNIHLLGFG